MARIDDYTINCWAVKKLDNNVNVTFAVAD